MSRHRGRSKQRHTLAFNGNASFERIARDLSGVAERVAALGVRGQYGAINTAAAVAVLDLADQRGEAALELAQGIVIRVRAAMARAGADAQRVALGRELDLLQQTRYAMRRGGRL